MLNNNLLLRGLILGLSIAAPVGPIGVLCIRRTLTDGQIMGLVSGLGAATADALYGAVAGFGLTVIAGLLVQQQGWMRVIGGVFLCYLGIKTLLNKPGEMDADDQKQKLGWRICLCVYPDIDQPDDHSFLCRYFCWRRHWQLLREITVKP